MSQRNLKDVVAKQLDQRWDAWAKAHPHLATAIDRTKLVDTAVQNLRDDPQFIAVMKQASVDEHTLAVAADMLAKIERMVSAWLP